MKKISYIFIALFAAVLSLYFNDTSASAAQSIGVWGKDVNGLTSIINSTTGVTGLDLDANTVDISYDPTYTVYTAYSATGVVQSTFKASEITTSKNVSIPVNGYMIMTNVGDYKGEPVDLKIVNTSDVTTPKAANLTVTKDGVITATSVSSSNGTNPLIKPVKQFTLYLLNGSTNTVLKNVPFTLTQYQQNDNLSSSNVSYGYDISSVEKLFALNGSVAASAGVYYDYQSNSKVMIESVTSSTLSYIFYGLTNSSTGAVNLYAGTLSGRSTINYNIMDTSASLNILPKKYGTTKTTVDATTTDDGGYISMSMTQGLVKQKIDNYYPTSGSMSLTLTEYVNYLDLTAADFTLSLDDGTVLTSSDYTTTINKGTSSATITFNFLGDFAKSNAGKTVTIKQKSKIDPDETIITGNLDGSDIYFPIATSLNYSLPSGVLTNPNVAVATKMTSDEFEVVPTLKVDLNSDQTAIVGSKVSSISVNNLASNPRNVYYSWDSVSVAYQNPDQVLSSEGTQTIPLVLTSSTFGTTQVVNATINVSSSYTLTYDGNGGLVNGKSTDSVNFNTTVGTLLYGSDKVSYSGYTFKGWATTKDGNSDVFAVNYVYGKIADEQKNTTLYAIWDKNTELNVSWDSSAIITETSKSIDKSLNSYSIPFYWNSTTKGTSYSIKQTYNEAVKDVKTVTQGTDSSTSVKDTFTVDTSDFAYGTNQVVFDFYELDSSGNVLNSSTPSGELIVTFDVSGSLQLQSAPSSVDWTNRLMRSSKGILNRDSDNTIELDVVDSRQDTTSTWYVQANATITNASVPFTFVWRSDTASSPVSLDGNNVKVMDSASSTKSGSYNYTQSWDNESGVLLDSTNYIKSGDYSDSATINWTLYDVAKAE